MGMALGGPAWAQDGVSINEIRDLWQNRKEVLHVPCPIKDKPEESDSFLRPFSVALRAVSIYDDHR